MIGLLGLWRRLRKRWKRSIDEYTDVIYVDRAGRPVERKRTLTRIKRGSFRV